MSKLILLTGCSRGCGRALLKEFTALGHTVLGCSRSANQIAELQNLYGEPHLFQALDVSNNDAVESWAQHCLENYGPPDILINNAAIIHNPAPLWKIPVDDFDAVIDINIKGTANVLRHFLPAMLQRRKGTIINFSSGWGRSTSPEVSAYCASKWAIEGMTQSLAQELPDGMAAVALNPGIINTDMLQTCFGANARSYPSAEKWAKTAAKFILKISTQDNGRALSVSDS